MTERTYVLVLDGGFAELERMRHYITSSSDFSAWWNYIPMVFLVESKLTAEAIGERLHELAPEARFLVTEANLAESQGWLPESSWKWIEKRAISKTPEQSSRF
ncbi:MAG TPA: hypothetical protein VNW90_03980 [Acetobacteraceae bacterium]|jgi:hypothetical protein|nr:hypothetical protein [Acetobacteraceae bacterium]